MIEGGWQVNKIRIDNVRVGMSPSVQGGGGYVGLPRVKFINEGLVQYFIYYVDFLRWQLTIDDVLSCRMYPIIYSLLC